jgi:hypothetical protein
MAAIIEGTPSSRRHEHVATLFSRPPAGPGEATAGGKCPFRSTDAKGVIRTCHNTAALSPHLIERCCPIGDSSRKTRSSQAVGHVYLAGPPLEFNSTGEPDQLLPTPPLAACPPLLITPLLPSPSPLVISSWLTPLLSITSLGVRCLTYDDPSQTLAVVKNDECLLYTLLTSKQPGASFFATYSTSSPPHIHTIQRKGSKQRQQQRGDSEGGHSTVD